MRYLVDYVIVIHCINIINDECHVICKIISITYDQYLMKTIMVICAYVYASLCCPLHFTIIIIITQCHFFGTRAQIHTYVHLHIYHLSRSRNTKLYTIYSLNDSSVLQILALICSVFCRWADQRMNTTCKGSKVVALQGTFRQE